MLNPDTVASWSSEDLNDWNLAVAQALDQSASLSGFGRGAKIAGTLTSVASPVIAYEMDKPFMYFIGGIAAAAMVLGHMIQKNAEHANYYADFDYAVVSHELSNREISN